MTRYYKTVSEALRELGGMGYRIPGKKTKQKYRLARHEDDQHILMVRQKGGVLDVMKINRASGSVEKIGASLGI